MKIITYELNEVPYRVLETYQKLFPNSTVSELMKRGERYETISEDEGILSPWITWPTVHRGVKNDKHCISDFGQDLSDLNNEYPNVNELLSKNGCRTGVFGSLHTYPLPNSMDNYEFYIPDTFAAGEECFPKEAQVFQRFNLKMVDQSARNVSAAGLPKAQAFDFLRNAAKLGVTPRTLYKLSGQLVSEKLSPARKVRRRTSQSQLAFDIFMKLLSEKRPDYTSYFTNHVASSMHRYWPGLYMSDYKSSSFSSEWLDTYKNEIIFTMHAANYHLRKLKAFVDKHKDTILIVMSSMGQAAVDGEEIVKKQLLLKNKSKFMQYLGFSKDDWSSERAMSPRFVFKMHDEQLLNQLKASLSDFKINGEPIDVQFHSHGVVRIKLGQINIDDLDLKIELDGSSVNPEDLGIENSVIEDSTGSFAYHVPEGSFLVYNPKQTKHVEKSHTAVATTEIAPAILSHFGIQPPGYMENTSLSFAS